jgi:hypothetical protein
MPRSSKLSLSLSRPLSSFFFLCVCVWCDTHLFWYENDMSLAYTDLENKC